MAASLVKGILLNQETKEYLPYEIIVLDISWKEKLMAIQDQVYDQLLIAKYQNLADNLPKDDLYEDAYNLLLKWINKLKNELAQLRAQSSTGFQQQQNIMNALENLAEKLQEEYLDALEKGDLDKAAELKKDLDVINQQIANLGNSNTDSYQNLLAKKQELEQKIANAQGDEKAALENQLSDVLTQLKIAEAFLDDKSKEGLNKLAELKEELSKALAANDLTGAAEISQDLADLLKLIPDDLLNSEQKAQELDEALAQIEDKAVQLAAQGNTGAAQILGDLADNLLAQKEDLLKGEDAAPVISRPDYYLLFKDFKGQDVKIYKPYLLIEKTIYIPVREVFEALGAKIFWKTEKNQVIIQDKYLLVEFELGSSILYLNDKKIELARDIEVIEGTTYLPLDILIKGYNLRADETGMPVVVLYRK